MESYVVSNIALVPFGSRPDSIRHLSFRCFGSEALYCVVTIHFVDRFVNPLFP